MTKRQPFLITECRRILKLEDHRRWIRAFALLNSRGVRMDDETWERALHG